MQPALPEFVVDSHGIIHVSGSDSTPLAARSCSPCPSDHAQHHRGHGGLNPSHRQVYSMSANFGYALRQAELLGARGDGAASIRLGHSGSDNTLSKKAREGPARTLGVNLGHPRT